MYAKDFDKWNSVKKRIQSENRQVYIRRGEIRWVSFGVNIGSEIDGKGASLTRPALVVHVIGAHLALIVPLSTKTRESTGYIPFEWKGILQSLCVHQVRVVSQKRILDRIGKISESRLSKYKGIISAFHSL